MLDEEECALVGKIGIDSRCERWKILGGRGGNDRRREETVDELRRMDIGCSWTTVERKVG